MSSSTNINANDKFFFDKTGSFPNRNLPCLNTKKQIQMKTTIITTVAIFAMMSYFALGANAQLSAPFAGGIKLQQGGAGSQSNGLIMKATAAAFNGGDYTLTWTAPPGTNGILKYTNTGVSSGTIGMSALDLTADVGASILPIANGGTNSTAAPTNGGISYGTGTAYAFSSAGTSGQ